MAGSASGTYGWASAVTEPAAPWGAGVFGWAATAVGLRNPTGSDTGTYGWVSTVTAPPAPWAAGVFGWSSAASGLRNPAGAGHGNYKLAGGGFGVTPYIPTPGPPPDAPPQVDVGTMLLEISMALNDLGAVTAIPDSRIAPCAVLLSKINSEWFTNPSQAAFDANSLATQLRVLQATSFPQDRGLAAAIDCAEQLAGTWSGDDYVS